MLELVYLSHIIRPEFLTMEFAANMLRKAEIDISANWIIKKTLDTIYAFAHDGGLDHALIDAGLSSDWGLFPPNGNKRICSEYDRCVNLFHECSFSPMGFYLPFIDFEISFMNHLMISPLQLHLVSLVCVKGFQH